MRNDSLFIVVVAIEFACGLVVGADLCWMYHLSGESGISQPAGRSQHHQDQHARQCPHQDTTEHPSEWSVAPQQKTAEAPTAGPALRLGREAA